MLRGGDTRAKSASQLHIGIGAVNNVDLIGRALRDFVVGQRGHMHCYQSLRGQTEPFHVGHGTTFFAAQMLGGPVARRAGVGLLVYNNKGTWFALAI